MERRKITELVERYRRNPELADVFVEGRTDRLFFDWYFGIEGMRDVKVYEIDTVDISPADCAASDLPDNRRSRVVILARELAAALGAVAAALRVCCVADRDTWAASLPDPNPMLFLTDYCDLESYLFSPYYMDKFIKLVLRIEKDSGVMLKQLERILTEVFMIRAANSTLRWGMHWIEFQQTCQVLPSSIAFNPPQFVDQYLMKNNRVGDKSQFMAAFDEARRKFSLPPHHRIRGHDMAALLYRYANAVLKSRMPFKDEDALERCMLGLLEVEHVRAWPLISAIRQRIASPSV